MKACVLKFGEIEINGLHTERIGKLFCYGFFYGPTMRGPLSSGLI